LKNNTKHWSVTHSLQSQLRLLYLNDIYPLLKSVGLLVLHPRYKNFWIKGRNWW